MTLRHPNSPHPDLILSKQLFAQTAALYTLVINFFFRGIINIVLKRISQFKTTSNN